MVKIKIDGQTLEVKQGSMIIEAADNARTKIDIPRFCYHKKLSVSANCRMCLVEVANGRKPVPACATPVTEGMEVFTKSPGALESQRAVMEFLLINHPLDCPICDQGGECELQDVAMGYGDDISPFSEGKRVVPDKDLGPLIATDMTRCIQCTRCVRFGEEIAGMRELGAVGRGEFMKITTFVEQSVDSEVSGNAIDVCPVGALTSKPFRYSARTWELRQQESIAPHDCLGSNIYFHTLGNDTVKRVVPRENESINEVWLSDRDRFSYDAVHSEERLLAPMIKQEDGHFKEVSWEEALVETVSRLKQQAAKQGCDKLGVLASPTATTEELYLLQKLMRKLGYQNIDHRLRERDYSDQASQGLFPEIPVSVEELEHADTVLLIGGNLRHEQPLAAIRVFKAWRNNATVMAINPADPCYQFECQPSWVPGARDFVDSVLQVVKAVSDKSGIKYPSKADAHLSDRAVSQEAQDIAGQLLQGERAVIALGDLAWTHPEASLLRSCAQWLSENTKATLFNFTQGANGAGAWLSGCVPHRGPAGYEFSEDDGLNAGAMIDESLSAYLLYQVEPELDCAHSGKALHAVEQADLVIAMTSYKNQALESYADILLPIATFAETSGTFVNNLGQWQSFTGAIEAAGQARPGWKVLRVLANHFELDGFDYMTSVEVLKELQDKVENQKNIAPKRKMHWPDKRHEYNGSLFRLAPKEIYAVDNLVRRSQTLLKTSQANQCACRVHPEVAEKNHLSTSERVKVSQGNGDFVTVLPLVLDESLPTDVVLIEQGRTESVGLGLGYESIELLQATS